MSTGAASPARRGTVAIVRRFWRLPALPMRMASFEHRGFRLDRPGKRALLEQHARSFLTGFNVAAREWAHPHDALARLPLEERGFAYEGAGMHAVMRDRIAAGRAFSRLLDGPGDGYAHLIHVGAGWPAGVLRSTPGKTLPATPLLRWLAYDGAGFAQAFFGGTKAIRRLSGRSSVPYLPILLAGCGRATWFIESADPQGIQLFVNSLPAGSRPHVWAGVGLAACYAGGASDDELDMLCTAAGVHRDHFGQGALFGIAARVRSGIIPEHTERAARHLFAHSADNAANWTDIALRGLTSPGDIDAYEAWRSRLRLVSAEKLAAS